MTTPTPSQQLSKLLDDIIYFQQRIGYYKHEIEYLKLKIEILERKADKLILEGK